MRFTTAESGYGPHEKFSAIEAMVRTHWDGTLRTDTAPDVTVQAIVRQSRWVVLCPFCPSAAYASIDDPRTFCIDCGNAAVEGRWVTVQWPPNAEEIELHLGVRSDPQNRCWEWGETVGDLAVENADNGASGLVIAR